MDKDYQSKRYRYYLLLSLTLIYAISFLDRQILVILQEPIKAELGLSDTQLGLMTGLAFAMFYVICGIPIARLAESYSRRNIIAISLTVWSGMTAICGMATNFWQLFAARIGVGVGEAGCSPPAHSMISDIFRPQERGTAMSIYSTGIYIGTLFGFLVGGWLNEALGWRMAFLIVGLPGILIAVILRLTIAEPKRTVDLTESVSVYSVAKFLFAKKSFVYISLGAALQAFLGYATTNWLPSIMVRNHGLSTGEIGAWMAITAGLTGLVGSVLGGVMADKLGARDKRWYIWVPAVSCCVLSPIQVYCYWAESPYLALALYAMPSMAFAMFLGPVIAASHSLVNSRMRALTSAFLFFVINFIGLGFGPLLVGVGSDILASSQGANSLRWSLTGFTVVVPAITLMCYVMAAKYFMADLDNEQTATDHTATVAT